MRLKWQSASTLNCGQNKERIWTEGGGQGIRQWGRRGEIVISGETDF